MGQAEYRAMLDAIIDANAEALANALWVAAPEPEPPVEPEPEPEPPDPIPPQPVGKPGPSNTGPADESLLVPTGSFNIREDNTVLENIDVTGLLWVRASNVTVRNFRVNGAGAQFYGVKVDPGVTGLVLEDGEILGNTSAGVLGGNWIARRLNVHDSGADGFKPNSNVLLEACWVHHIGSNVGAHADAVQIRGATNVVIRGNFFDVPFPPPSGFSTNSCLIMDASTAPLANVLVEGNWLSGGAYTVYLSPKGDRGVSDIALRDNRFTRRFAYGPLSDKWGGAVITGNVWEDTGELMEINNA